MRNGIEEENDMRTSRKLMRSCLALLPLLAFCGTASAQDAPPEKVNKTMKKSPGIAGVAQPAPLSPDMARLSGKIGVFENSASESVKQAACSAIDVTIKRCTNCFQPNQTQETLATLKAMGGTIATGCSYTSILPKGPGVVVSAVIPLSSLNPPPPPPPAGPSSMSGWNGPFDLQTNMSKDVKMIFYFN